MGDNIGLGLSSMAVCFDFRSTNVVQLSNRNPYFYWFRHYHPLGGIQQLRGPNFPNFDPLPRLSMGDEIETSRSTGSDY